MQKKTTWTTIITLVLLILAAGAPAQEDSTTATLTRASKSVRAKLEQSIQELNALRERAADEKIPLSRKLNALEAKLVETRQEYQEVSRTLDSRTLDLSNLRSDIKARTEESTYLANLLSEYIRNFESGLHIAEIERYEDVLESARLAGENSSLDEKEVYHTQAALLRRSLERLQEAMGGAVFKGTAVQPDGEVKQGTFLLVGPTALFQSLDKQIVGTAEQKIGSLKPAVVPFEAPQYGQIGSELIASGAGRFPLDPTLGNAHKIAETKEPFLDHVKKGGPVMIPIFALAGLALLVAIYKWLSMVFIRMPSKRRIQKLLDAVEVHDKKLAKQRAREIRGPVGRMLSAGVQNIKHPRELIEEVMYEKILATRLKLERFLPFIAISAASAPLLGLLGTVTGIINTFRLLTIFGSGDVKTLSGGISEALITTKFGLIVAIPSLLLHAFLSRKARSILNQMEKSAVAFVNQVGKTPYKNTHFAETEPPKPASPTAEPAAAEDKPEKDVKMAAAPSPAASESL